MQNNYALQVTNNLRKKKVHIQGELYIYLRTNNVRKKSENQEQAKFIIDIKIIDIRAALTSTEESLPFQIDDYASLK